MHPADTAESVQTGNHASPGGSVLDVMVFNIWHGGHLDGHEPAAVQDQNLDELIDYLAHERPDLIFLIETYGAGHRIEAALNRDQRDGRVFPGTPVSADAMTASASSSEVRARVPIEHDRGVVAGPGISCRST